jgi:hypothetical protein
MEKVIALINKATFEIQNLVNLKYAKVSGHTQPDSPLNQVNLLGGDKIVRDYLDHGEMGLALDHLNYMVEETGIQLPPDLRATLAEISGRIS